MFALPGAQPHRVPPDRESCYTGVTMSNALSNWKSIVVFLDHTPKGENVGHQAADLAERCRAHLIGVCVLPYYFDEHPSASFARGREAVREISAAEETDQTEKAQAVRQGFAAIVGRRPISSEMRFFVANWTMRPWWLIHAVATCMF